MTDAGFEKGTPQNLPLVDFDMYLKFIQENECFHKSEMRGVKLDRSTRPSYGDAAVGYVQVKRDSNRCTVKLKICPEHKLRNKLYDVTIIIDELEEEVELAQCHGCVAAQGGCKHIAAAMKWLNLRTEEPACTSTECYWAGPKLKKVVTELKDITLREMLTKTENENEMEDPALLEFVCNEAKSGSNIHLIQHFRVDQMRNAAISLSIHQLSCSYQGDRSNVEQFIKHVKNNLTEDRCNLLYQSTKTQSSNPLWHELRYGRITASKIYESIHCSTPDGALVNFIMGGKIRDNPAMKRGRDLEEHVIKCVEKHLKTKIKRCGLLLSDEYPVIGASPDGIAPDFVIEIKCPSKEKTFHQYYKDNEIKPKFKCQIQLQMLLSKKSKCFFCVAHPDFETSNEVTIVEEKFNENFILPIVNQATLFWKTVIFPKIM